MSRTLPDTCKIDLSNSERRLMIRLTCKLLGVQIDLKDKGVAFSVAFLELQAGAYQIVASHFRIDNVIFSRWHFLNLGQVGINGRCCLCCRGKVTEWKKFSSLKFSAACACILLRGAVSFRTHGYRCWSLESSAECVTAGVT